jgi:hypothetical protein
MRKEEHLARIDRKVIHLKLWWETRKEMGLLGRSRHKWKDNVNVDFRRTVCGFCEHGNKPSCFIKCREMLEQLSNW